MYDTDLMTRIARMYYEKDMSQQEIAEATYVSRSMVSRMLKKAKELGIVEIIIKPTFENYYKYENELEAIFPDCKFLIAYSENSDVEDEFDVVCSMGASTLDDNLSNESILAVSRGKTVANTINMLKPERNYPDMHIVQLTGSLFFHDNSKIDEMNNSQRVASLYGCKLSRLFAPYLMDDKETKQIFCKHAATSEVLEMGCSVNTFITGVDTILFWRDYLDDKDLSYLSKKNAVGCMWGYFFDENGNIIDSPLYERSMIPDKSIFTKAGKRICIANDRFKSHALLGALRGKLCNVLVTNSKIASRLIDLNNKDLTD